MSIYETGLEQNPANYTPLSPVSLLRRAAWIYPDKPAVIQNDRVLNWGEVFQRCQRMASALTKRGLGKGDTVAILSANTAEMFEVHFAVPMMGGVLNAINMRLDAKTVAFILEHGEAKLLLVDKEFGPLAEAALALLSSPPAVVHIDDKHCEVGHLLGDESYDDLLAAGEAAPVGVDSTAYLPDDEWQAIALNYTSGTTGNPKGVVYHHRGAYLNAVSNALSWHMGDHPVYLWTLPMFHCNGWCFPWTLAANAGASVCLRQVRDDAVYQAMGDHKVTHFCGAPVVLNTLLAASDELKALVQHPVKVMTAGAPPPAGLPAPPGAPPAAPSYLGLPDPRTANVPTPSGAWWSARVDVADATRDSDGAVRCLAPAAAEGDAPFDGGGSRVANVTVSLNGQQFTAAALAYEYFGAPVPAAAPSPWPRASARSRFSTRRAR